MIKQNNLQKKILASLHILNDVHFIEIVLNSIRTVTKKYDLSKTEVNRMELATEEAINNVFTLGYGKGEEAYYDVELNITNMDFNIIIKDTGMPFDFAKMDYDKDHLDGMGVHMMYQLVDNVEFSFGSNGREQHLIKHLKKLPEYEKSLSADEEKIDNKDITFDFHKIREEESLAVAQCVYDEYSYTYPYEMVYYPKLFYKACENGEVYSLVATAPNGEIAGHLALTMNPDLPGIAEMGIGVVRKKYREFHIMGKLTKDIIDIAKNVLHLNGMFAQPVAYHTITQHISLKNGMHACGFALAYTNEDLSSHINNSHSRRSFGVAMLPFHDELRTYYAHPDVKQLAGIIYNGYYKREEGHKTYKPEKTSCSKFSVNDPLKLAKIYVDVAGEDWENTLKNYILSIKRSKSRVIELYININHPSAVYAYEVAKSLNFFATGILPMSDKGDYLTTECLLNEVMDYDSVKTIETFTPILNIIKTLDPDKNEK